MQTLTQQIPRPLESTITVPYRFTPRRYQLPILKALDSGIRRAVWVAHRRSGKDKTCVNLIVKKMLERVGTYYYVFPTYNQGRKVLWDGIDLQGRRFLDHFPTALLDGKPNITEMKIRFKNGSLFQVVGADNIDTIVGTNPVGVVFSEFSLMDPAAWRFLRPILAENGGWAVFVFTPRGENHAYDIFNLAKGDPVNWFCQVNPVSSTGAISLEILEQERREIIHQDGNDALYQQEYECNFTVPIAGAYYAVQIMRAYQEGRVGRVPYDPRYKVDTWWDLGINDRMAIWFTQTMGAALHVIDYLEDTGQGIGYYAHRLQEKGYVYGTHTAPHDIKVRELTSGRSRMDTARNLGIEFRATAKLPLGDGIDSTRVLLPKCWFDAEKCADGLNALKNYRKQYDERRKTYLNTPFHDWSSNGADAFRTCAMGIDMQLSGYQAAKRDPWLAEDSRRREIRPDAM